MRDREDDVHVHQPHPPLESGRFPATEEEEER